MTIMLRCFKSSLHFSLDISEKFNMTIYHKRAKKIEHYSCEKTDVLNDLIYRSY